MALKKAFVFVAFLLFLAFCNVPIRGRDVAKRGHTITNTQYAGYLAQGKWHGVRAKINVWGLPDVQPKSYSAAYIAARSHSEFIAAGIHTSNGKPAMGCYNTQCKGFVVARETNTYPGQALAPPFSTYQGEQKYITLRIKKDEKTGDWSLYREDQGGPIGGTTLLGWWPKTLFEDLQYLTTQIEWKGEVSYHSNEKSPPMGSGHYAEQYEGRAAFFKNILAYSSKGERVDPERNSVSVDIDKPVCYDASTWFKNKHSEDGYHFFYGGPSGCSDRD
ncbi:hypothetical protein LUZ60_001517 [Juncus effusus]|nr:hypothetical protein LUZ60_001517 [Juncus effusus]